MKEVAPYVGAWIETTEKPFLMARLKVAPYVGAWIETYASAAAARAQASHPTWVRGLKPFLVDQAKETLNVAPYVGAWIETASRLYHRQHDKSHPTWVRGLKQ